MASVEREDCLGGAALKLVVQYLKVLLLSIENQRHFIVGLYYVSMISKCATLLCVFPARGLAGHVRTQQYLK